MSLGTIKEWCTHFLFQFSQGHSHRRRSTADAFSSTSNALFFNYGCKHFQLLELHFLSSVLNARLPGVNFKHAIKTQKGRHPVFWMTAFASNECRSGTGRHPPP